MSRCPPALAATAAGGPGGFVTKMKWYLQNGHDTITINAAGAALPGRKPEVARDFAGCKAELVETAGRFC